MWHQWFNLNVMKLREYFLCAKKTKILTLFSDFFSSVSVFNMFMTVPWHTFFCCLCRIRKLSDFNRHILICVPRSYGFGTTWRWVILLFGWTIPLNFKSSLQLWIRVSRPFSTKTLKKITYLINNWFLIFFLSKCYNSIFQCNNFCRISLIIYSSLLKIDPFLHLTSKLPPSIQPTNTVFFFFFW